METLVKTKPAAKKSTLKLGEIVTLLLKTKALTREQVEYAARVHSKIKTNKPFLEVLKELEYVTDQKIRETIQANIVSLRIGDLLVELGLLSPADLAKGLKVQSEEKPKRKLGEVLVAQNLIDEIKLIETLSLQLGFISIEPEFTEIDLKLFHQGPVRIYRDHNFVPIQKEDGVAIVAFADPLDRDDLESANRIFGNKIRPAISSKRSIQAAISKITPDTVSDPQAVVKGDRIVEVVDDIIVQAIEQADVSDIHIDPLEDRIRVRYRMDGVLVQYKDLPKDIAPALSSRIKVLCKADIAERRRHQGGRILYDLDNIQMDLRVSFYVTIHGEKIVLRLLNRQNKLLSIDDIGMAPRLMKRFCEEALDRPSGVVLITGPTGSGKTTTVYSCINHLNNPETSIITAEDPVEYVIDGIGQCSIDPKINLTYDETLRHMVRQDPDVIVIGEIRDTFSAEVAVQAALTGHKVLTTFHTEDTIGGLLRLLNLDIDAFLISSTVVCVVAQRLLRRICPQCAMPYDLTPTDLLRSSLNPDELSKANFSKGKGCDLCRYTGYKGRVAVFEVLVLNEMVRDGLIQRKTSHQIRRISVESTGLVTMFEDGLHKAANGVTTLSEVLRCLPKLQKPRPLVELGRLLGS